MPDKSSSTSTGYDGQQYTVTSSGTNSQVAHPKLVVGMRHADRIQGNNYDSRDYGSSASNSNSYHYSNRYVTLLVCRREDSEPAATLQQKERS